MDRDLTLLFRRILMVTKQKALLSLPLLCAMKTNPFMLLSPSKNKAVNTILISLPEVGSAHQVEHDSVVEM
jgi:hypothetical protein